jgi:hypothetical protein
MNMRHTLLFVLIFVLGVYFISCTPQKREEKAAMTMIVETLKKENIEQLVMTNANKDAFVVVPKFGARILTTSLGGKNLFWTHPDVLLGQGGQRSWVSPEGGDKGFLFKADWTGNRDFSMMDPGDYERIYPDVEDNYIRFQNSFQTTSNDGKDNYDLTLTRCFDFEENPLLGRADFEGLDYHYLGIDFMHALKNNSSELLDQILDLWCLIQVPPIG